MIDLTPYKDCAQQIKKGMTIKFKFEIGGKSYFFKKNPPKVDKQLNKEVRYDYYEVLTSYILEKTGCKNFVKYDFATFKGYNGTLSESFLKNDEREMSLAEIMLFLYANKKYNKVFDLNTVFDAELLTECYKKTRENEFSVRGCIWTIPQILNNTFEFAKTYNITLDSEEISKNLSKIAVYDYFLGNTDRNWYNIAFVYSLSDKNLKVAPIFDNGSNFDSYFYVVEKEVPHIFSLLGYSGLTDEAFENNNLLNNGGLLVVDILEEMKKDNEIANLVETFKTFDMASTINDFEKEKNIKINSDIKNKIIQSFDLRASTFQQKELKLNKKLNKNNERNY